MLRYPNSASRRNAPRVPSLFFVFICRVVSLVDPGFYPFFSLFLFLSYFSFIFCYSFLLILFFLSF